MQSLIKLAGIAAVFAAAIGQAHASIVFSFSQSGGNVVMQSSGVLNTANLVSVSASGWGGTGIETNAPPESDIMGDTSMGGIDTAFGFSSGTDLSAWVGDMFTADGPFFGFWTSIGTTQFTTYYIDNGRRTPGIGIAAEDLVGALWTPDVSWTAAGTLASIGLTEGTYAITDARSGESITIQIGEAAVPIPATLALMGLGLVGIGYRRRNQIKAV